MAMTQSEFRALLHRYQTGTCTPAEKRRIEDWYAGLGAERQLELTPDERAALTATVWQRIAQRTTLLPPARPVPTYRTGWPVAKVRWAAVAVLALGAGLAGTYWAGGLPWRADGPVLTSAGTPAPTWVQYRNTLAHATRVALPDGSAVTLAPASALKYPRAFAGARRTVYLTGEAFFEVFHDARHPFSVYTEQVVTTVLGTSFRVRAYAGQTEAQVQVRTGAVRVSPRRAATPANANASAPSLVVRPNQQAVYSVLRRQLRRELVPQPVLLAPQAFVFDDRPVAEVLAALQKAYGIAIAYDAAALRHCTINLSLGQEPLFEKLDIICETLGASYEKADGRILFHSQPCPAE